MQKASCEKAEDKDFKKKIIQQIKPKPKAELRRWEKDVVPLKKSSCMCITQPQSTKIGLSVFSIAWHKRQ